MAEKCMFFHAVGANEKNLRKGDQEMKRYFVKGKKVIATFVLAFIMVCAAAQTAQAACELEIMGLASSNRECVGWRKSSGGKYWSYTHGHDHDANGHGYNLKAFAKLDYEKDYVPANGVGEVSVNSNPKDTKGNAQHIFISGSGYREDWTQN